MTSIIEKMKNEDEKEELNLIKRNTRRLQTLINQLLSLSKLESGTMKLNARRVNIVKLTRLYLQSFHSLVENKSISLVFESDADEYVVYLDAIKYEKIANKLISTAFKFIEREAGSKSGLRFLIPHYKVEILPLKNLHFLPHRGTCLLDR